MQPWRTDIKCSAFKSVKQYTLPLWMLSVSSPQFPLIWKDCLPFLLHFDSWSFLSGLWNENIWWLNTPVHINTHTHKQKTQHIRAEFLITKKTLILCTENIGWIHLTWSKHQVSGKYTGPNYYLHAAGFMREIDLYSL